MFACREQLEWSKGSVACFVQGLPPKAQTTNKQTNDPTLSTPTPLTAGMDSIAEYRNDWHPILALIRTLADMRCIIRCKEVVKWLIDDVARTLDALDLEMFHAFTKQIMPRGSKEKPADVFERIWQQAGRV